MSHFFAYLSKMKYIERWNIMRNTHSENILEHSAQCAMIAHGLCVIQNHLTGSTLDPAQVSTHALFHEVSEVITGDLATPIKYFNPEIKRAYQQIEHVAEQKLVSMLPDEFALAYAPLITDEAPEEIHALVKAADKLCAYIKCVEELKGGNTEFSRAAEKIRAELDQNPLACVAYFLTHFIPSFSLTLDELN